MPINSQVESDDNAHLQRRVVASGPSRFLTSAGGIESADHPIARILLVEDQDLDARLVDLALRRPVESSFEILRARTLEEAMHCCATQNPELVLLDLSLPDADGLESLRTITEAYPELPVIVLSANTEMELAVRALENGAEDYLYKDDFNQKILKRSILYSLERNRNKLKVLEMERRMQEILRLESLGTLAGGLAHEFNNALTAVVGNISMLAVQLAGQPEQARLLREAGTSLDRARHLSHQLLALSRKGQLEVATMPTTELLQLALKFMKSGVSCPVDLQLPPDVWPVKVDENLILHVLNSVLNNAMEAMNWQGEIQIRAKNLDHQVEMAELPLVPRRYVVISIEDGGHGIPAHLLGKVFDPYFTTRGEGRGVGLTNTISILKQHGGWITLSPRSGGQKGAIATLYLPAADPAEVAARAHHKRDHVVEGKGRVLLMDDDKAVQTSVSYMLRKLGYEVTVAAEGELALEVFDKERKEGNGFDLLILDLTVPGGMGGKEMMARIREIAPETAAIVSSGYSDDDVLARFAHYGFRARLPKPFTFQQLSQVVAEVMQSDPAPAS